MTIKPFILRKHRDIYGTALSFGTSAGSNSGPMPCASGLNFQKTMEILLNLHRTARIRNGLLDLLGFFFGDVFFDWFWGALDKVFCFF
jgi:hypothetical protein